MTSLNRNFIAFRFAGCQQTALGDDFLAEIGRITVHYGMFVAQVNAFVNALKSKNIREWQEISDESAVCRLPDILRSLEPKFPTEYVDWLRNGQQQVVLAQSVFERASLGRWGVHIPEGRKFAISTRIQKDGGRPSMADRHLHTSEDLYLLAMEVSLATRYLAYLQQELMYIKEE